MNEDNILLEGGAAGHMNHLYDNGELTFSKLIEIFNAAAEGKLEGTEKTDGQNLMISYSVKDGRAKGVRNKSEIKGGGLNPEQLAAKFADRANPALKETFADALRAFEKAIQSLSHNEQIELFGPETNIFYNAEVMDPRTPNVISYDTKTLVIHRAGHFEFDRKTGEKTNRDLSQIASNLEKIISDMQDKIKHDNYGVQVNAIKKLKGLNDKKPLNTAISKINNLLSSVNSHLRSQNLFLNTSSSIDDYMVARVYIIVSSILLRGKVKLNPVAKMNITKKILGVKGISKNDIKKKISPEELEFAETHLLNDSSRKEILKTAIIPLENIVSDFAVEMLKGLQSAFVIDNSKEVQRLKSELQKAISAIESSGNEEAMSILKQQMTKLKSAENVDAAAEGFVFDYDGVTYKFTGNFAPMNQILGLFKYGRGNVPPLQKLSEAKGGNTIAVVPGAFKPPHKGHLAMIKKYAKIADKVVVMVSPLARDLPNGKPVTFKISKKIWDIYLKAEKLDNKVIIMNSPFSSPVRAAYEFVGNKDNREDFAQPGQTIILGTSTKGGDESRFERDVTKYARPNVKVEVKPIDSKGDISATDMRAAISSSDIKTLMKFLPDSIDKKKTAGMILSLFSNQQIKLENIVYDIINEYKNKTNKYFLLSKRKISKKENMSSGSVTGYSAPLAKKVEK
jgi:cytidyltransferase-like protein